MRLIKVADYEEMSQVAATIASLLGISFVPEHEGAGKPMDF